MTTQAQPRTISLSAELARPDDDRHRSAVRWHAALHRLCVLRATTNETSYETEWARIFDTKALLADLNRPTLTYSKLLCFATLDVLEIQHEHLGMVLRMDGIEQDEAQTDEYCELLAALRYKVDNDLP